MEELSKEELENLPVYGSTPAAPLPPKPFQFILGGKLKMDGRVWLVRKVTKKDIVLREITRSAKEETQG